jgi:hypothetical protein
MDDSYNVFWGHRQLASLKRLTQALSAGCIQLSVELANPRAHFFEFPLFASVMKEEWGVAQLKANLLAQGLTSRTWPRSISATMCSGASANPGC